MGATGGKKGQLMPTDACLEINYDALLRHDFVGHTGSGRPKVEF